MLSRFLVLFPVFATLRERSVPWKLVYLDQMSCKVDMNVPMLILTHLIRINEFSRTCFGTFLVPEV